MFELFCLFQETLTQLEAENPSANSEEYKRLIPRKQKQSNEQISASNIPTSDNKLQLDRRRTNGERRRPSAPSEISQPIQQNPQFSSRESSPPRDTPRRGKADNHRFTQRGEIPTRLNPEEVDTSKPIRTENVPVSDERVGHRLANHRPGPKIPQLPIITQLSIPANERAPDVQVPTTGSPEQRHRADLYRYRLRTAGSERSEGVRQQGVSSEVEAATGPSAASEEVVTRRNFQSRSRSRIGSSQQSAQVRFLR